MKPIFLQKSWFFWPALLQSMEASQLKQGLSFHFQKHVFISGTPLERAFPKKSRMPGGPTHQFRVLWHMAVGQNQWYHFGVGAPPILEPIGIFTGGTGF